MVHYKKKARNGAQSLKARGDGAAARRQATRKPTVSEEVFRAFITATSGATGLEELDLIQMPSEFVELEQSLRESFDAKSLIDSQLFAEVPCGEIQLRTELRRPATLALVLRKARTGSPYKLAFEGCSNPERLVDALLSEYRTLKLTEQTGGIILAVPGIREVMEWRLIGVPAIPIQALSNASQEQIISFWHSLKIALIPRSAKRTKLVSQRTAWEKKIDKKSAHRGYAEHRIRLIRAQLRRDIVICAPTVSPSMTVDTTAVSLLRRLEAFAPSDRLRVAQWRPHAVHLGDFQRLTEEGAARQARDVIYRTLAEDLFFLSIDCTPAEPCSLSQSYLQPRRNSSVDANYVRAVEREIIAPLLDLDETASPTQRALRMAQATVVGTLAERRGPLSRVNQLAIPQTTAAVDDFVKLTSTLIKLAQTELNVTRAGRG